MQGAGHPKPVSSLADLLAVCPPWVSFSESDPPITSHLECRLVVLTAACPYKEPALKQCNWSVATQLCSRWKAEEVPGKFFVENDQFNLGISIGHIEPSF